MVREHAVGPWTIESQDYPGRPSAPLAPGEEGVRRRRVEKNRSHAPDDSRRRRTGGRQKEALQGVGEPRLGLGKEAVERRERDDRADNEVPVTVQGERNDRLNVQRIAKGVVMGTAAPVEVVLERDLDHAGD